MVELKNTEEIQKIQESCRLVVQALEMAASLAKPGVTTRSIDEAIEDYIRAHDAEPAFKGYKGFPASACISINDAVVHGIPSDDQILEEGQIVGVDVGVIKDGFFGDSAVTLAVGEIRSELRELMDVTKAALYKGIEKAEPGNRVHDISQAIQAYVEKHSFNIVRELVGHGIGRQLHEKPEIPNFGKAGTGMRLKPGMVFCIEPMVNAGTFDVFTDDDGWTVRTEDGHASAHYEHTIWISDDGPVILTRTDLF